jgi:hypothetical protein
MIHFVPGQHGPEGGNQPQDGHRFDRVMGRPIEYRIWQKIDGNEMKVIPRLP